MSDCILWLGTVNNRGYGLTYHDGRRVSAHRDTFRKAYGYLPAVVMHRCDVPLCVNPDHLVAGTQVDNMQDCRAKGRLKRPPNELQVRGDKHPRTKLTDAKLRELKPLIGTMSNRRLARLFDVDESTLRTMLQGPRLSGLGSQAGVAAGSTSSCGSRGLSPQKGNSS